MGAWENLVGDNQLSETLPSWVGIDMALKHDSVAVVIAQPQEDGIVLRSKIWNPSEEGIDVSAVEQYLRELHLKYEIKEFAYDPAYFQRSAEALVDDGLPMVEFPQSGNRMVPACGNAYELIVNKKVIHDGSPTFTDQVLSAAQRITETGWRLSKNKSRRKIDACIAMVIALDRATSRVKLEESPTVLNIWD
jgi:phage terminase large subunit-like protein